MRRGGDSAHPLQLCTLTREQCALCREQTQEVEHERLTRDVKW